MPKLFISYRRADNAYAARQIHASLGEHFGTQNVIFDVESIQLGANFRSFLNDQVSQCDVLLAIIGKEWLKLLKERSDVNQDFVRIEIETALSRKIPVLPVLVDNALMPGESDLPDSLTELASINAITVRADADFTGQMSRLIAGLDTLIESEKVRKRELAKQQQAEAKRAKQEQERLERERIAREKEEREKIEQEKLEQARLEQQRLVRESIELEKQTQVRLEQNRLEHQQEQLSLERERSEQERLACDKAEQDKQEQARVEQAKLAQQQEQLRLERERSEREVLEKQQRERLLQQKQAQEQQEKEQLRRDKERQAQASREQLAHVSSARDSKTSNNESDSTAFPVPRRSASSFGKVVLFSIPLIAIVIGVVMMLDHNVFGSGSTQAPIAPDPNAQRNDEVKRYLAQAKNAKEDEAIELYQKVVGLDKQNQIALKALEGFAAPYLNKAKLALDNYRLDVAQQILDKAESIYSDNPRLELYRTSLATKTKANQFAVTAKQALAMLQLGEAKKLLDELKKLDPLQPELSKLLKEYELATNDIGKQPIVTLEKIIPWDDQKPDDKSTPVMSVAFSRDGKTIVSGGYSPDLNIIDAIRGKTEGKTDKSPYHNVSSIAFSPDGTRIVSGNFQNGLCIWNMQSGKPDCLPNSSRLGLSVAINPTGTRIVSGNYDGDLQLWDAQTGEPIGKPWKGHTDEVKSVAFSPDGTRIVSGSKDKTVRLWNTDTGKPIGSPLTGHTDSVMSVAFSPDGKRIVSGSWDKTLRLWDAATGESIGAPLSGHTLGVNSVAFSPDGNTIVSGSNDKTLHLWDAKTGESLGPPVAGHTSDVNSVAFSPDGTRLVSGSYDGTIRLWDVHQ